MEIDKKLYEEIKSYCKLNGLKTSEYVNGLLKKAFLEEKYGKTPFSRNDKIFPSDDGKKDNADDIDEQMVTIPKNYSHEEINHATADNSVRAGGTEDAPPVDTGPLNVEAAKNEELANDGEIKRVKKRTINVK